MTYYVGRIAWYMWEHSQKEDTEYLEAIMDPNSGSSYVLGDKRFGEMAKESRREAARDRARSTAQAHALFKERLAPSIPAEDPSIRARCVCCEKPSTHTCSGCQSARYCSRECQRKDWPLHKILCKDYLVKFADNRRPLPNYVRGICFPDDKTTPEHVWIEQPYACSNGIAQTQEWLQKNVGPYAGHLTMTVVSDFLKWTLKQDIGHGLVMLCQTGQPDRGFALNKSIMALGPPGHMETAFGKRVVVGAVVDKAHESGSRVVLADANFRDLRHSVDNFRTWPWNPAVVDPEKMSLVDKIVPGLLLHCDGSFHRYQPFGLQRRVKKVSVRLYQGHDPEHEQAIAQVDCLAAKQVGLDWLVRRYPSTREFATGDHNSYTLRNDMAVNLVPTNPVSNGLRNQALGRDLLEKGVGLMNIGNMVLLERHGGQVEPEHLECLNAFISGVKRYQKEDHVIWEDGVQMLWVGEEEAGVEDAKKAFMSFWKKWKKVKKAVEGISLDHLPSPYKIRGPLQDGELTSEKLDKGMFNATIIPGNRGGSMAFREVVKLRVLEEDKGEADQEETAEGALQHVQTEAENIQQLTQKEEHNEGNLE